MTPERLLDVGTVARMFHVTRGTVLYWIKAGKLAAERDSIRGWYRIRPSAIAAMKQNAQNAQTSRPA